MPISSFICHLLSIFYIVLYCQHCVNSISDIFVLKFK
nr:MAG TPA: hypothetical protein [Caudoviricetes sp.]